MKKITQIFALLFLSLAVIGVYSSCEKESSGAAPRIDYVRVTSPESSDSLLIGAGQGQLIAIIGDNLAEAVEIWFNDQKAVLTPTYITKTTILVAVPTKIPASVNNTLKIVFANGSELLHKFEVQISKPVVNSMLSEFVNQGDVATIRGNYFYLPLTVTFTGGVTGTLVLVKDQELTVTVPAGALPGPITVKTNFGEAKSNFWFRDNRNIFISGDPHQGWWSTYHVTTPGPTDPPKINGNYYRFKKLVKAWTWDSPEVAGGDANSNPQSKNIPDAAILKPEDYNLKFEINTVKPYTSNTIKLNVALKAEDNDNYVWQPPYDSKGKWNTIIIPFEQVVASYKVKPTISTTGYWSRILIFGPGDLDADIAFDNFRIVPKISR